MLLFFLSFHVIIYISYALLDGNGEESDYRYFTAQRLYYSRGLWRVKPMHSSIHTQRKECSPSFQRHDIRKNQIEYSTVY